MTAIHLTLIGRSSSTFTRVTRIFAAELGLRPDFEIVRNIQSLDAQDYGGNPALKVPSLRTPDGTWFGALNICRELVRFAERPLRVVWPEALEHPLLANTQEMILQAMSTEVGLIMSRVGDQPTGTFHQVKMTESLTRSLAWLDANLGVALGTLPPERDLSYLEVTLFCLFAHLDFRQIVATAPYPKLVEFKSDFGARASCQLTEYKFDV